MTENEQIQEMEIALREAQHEYSKAWSECFHNCGKRPERETVFYAKYLVNGKGYRKVERGEWVDKPTGAYGRMQSWCTACGNHSGIGGIKSNRHKPFCPNCGADMRGKAE